MDTVKIFDTTLRDGEQSPGISLDVSEKLEIADQLARLGVDVIEAGFPIASDGDFESVEAIAKTVRGPIITGLSRTAFKDVDRAWEAVRHADKARIHVFIATSKIHMEKKLRMTPEQVKQEAGGAVARAKTYLQDVEFSPEDGYRSDPDFMCEVCQIAVDAGATTLNIPDTVGFAVPDDYAKLIKYVIDTVNGEFVVSTHCHNDLGLAVANSLAGVSAGARQVECAINGLGERAGNAALEEVVMAIRTRRDHFAEVDVNVRSEELARTSRMVARLTGYHVQYNKAVVGRNAFAHEAGIHQHGVLADRETYEIIDASSVGQEAAQIVLGKHSGRHAFADTLEKMGIHVQGDALNRAFVRFKELADKKVDITEADLEAIIAEEIGSGLVHRYGLLELEVRGGTNTPPTARVIVTDADDKIEATGTGDGMIDAAIAAIVEATGVPGKVGNFQVSSVTGGSDALGAVTITVEAEGHKVTGRGVATDVVEASARAYLNAVNKFTRLRERGDEVREPMAGP
ncbi:MAG: 2-isopropylmalate synthase [Actinomycetota bacterium]|jgi:2-isopropylmalate synthase|nr:2-isopropylmalate synthase [Actinomycetota bacterium]MDQ1476113.1 2-isopropylmalate synthase [Actinomycetota bacterium]